LVRAGDGQGVPQDYAEALKWFRIAAKQGEAKGQFNLGVAYSTADAAGAAFGAETAPADSREAG
jgi:TPR repeat protein